MQAALFAALIILMASVPFLGFIPLGFMRATTLHIPVILGAVLLETEKRRISWIYLWYDKPDQQYDESDSDFFCILTILFFGRNSRRFCEHSDLFSAEDPDWDCPLLCVSGWSRRGQRRKKEAGNTALFLAGISGSMTNTLLVMNMIYLFFREDYAKVNQMSADTLYGFILSVIGINGVPEAVVAAVLTVCIGRVLLRLKRRQQ